MTSSCPNRSSWCFLCVSWIPDQRKKKSPVSRPLTEALLADIAVYFGSSLNGFGQPWAPQQICMYCYTCLSGWRRTGSRGLPVTVPAKWSPPEEHHPGSRDSNCFFCRSISPRGPEKEIPFFDGCVQRPVRRERKEAYPVRVLPEIPAEQDSSSSELEDDDKEDPDWTPEDGSILPYIGPLDQGMLDYLLQMVTATKEDGQFIGSFLLNAGLLKPGTKINQRNRSKEFEKFFAVQTITYTEQKKNGTSAEVIKEVAYCTDIDGLLQTQGVVHQKDHWRLYMDGSQKSFKCFLLHNEVDKSKRLPSVLVLIGNDVPEKYQTIRAVLALLKYADYGWMVQADLKLINIISGMKMAACKYPCFICRWDSKDKNKHYLPGHSAEWTEEERQPGNFSFIEEPLVPAAKIVLPELHVKLGVFQVYIKRLCSLHEENPRPAYEHYLQKFKLSEEKLKAGAINGVDVRRLVDDEVFAELLESEGASPESEAWQAFVQVDKRFFGKDDRPEDYQVLVGDMIGTFQRMGCNMSLKMHLMVDHLDLFPAHLGTWSDQHGERGHQEVKSSARLYGDTRTTRVLTERMHQVKRPSAQPPHCKHKRSHF